VLTNTQFGHSESFFYSSQQVEMFAHLSSGWRFWLLMRIVECRLFVKTSILLIRIAPPSSPFLHLSSARF
jgi:hypothetical protein